MKNHAEFRNKKMYLEFDEGQIIFNNQRVQRVINNESIETFYDLVQFWLIQKKLTLMHGLLVYLFSSSCLNVFSSEFAIALALTDFALMCFNRISFSNFKPAVSNGFY